jgi:SAM-dependent methyltransferase
MIPRYPEPLSALDLVEAFQLGHAVSTLHDLEILVSLERSSTAETLAKERRLDADLLRGVLDYVAERTDLVRKTGARFVATRNYSKECRFLLDLYAGAYRGNAVQLKKVIGKPSLAPGAVDRVRQARAFEVAGILAQGWVTQIIQQLQLNHILDIGCGTAALLVQLAAQDPKFVGWGLEVNPAMCKVARANIRAARVGGRVKLLEGDSTQLRAVLPADMRSNIRTVTASQVANEMFGAGSSRILSWLRDMREMLPGRALLLSDYYGRLGSKMKRRQRETLLHDYAQLISGQGVPPAAVAEWRTIYEDAGCRLMYVIEDKRTTRFVHVVML